MTILEAVQAFVDARAALQAAEDENNNMRTVLLPNALNSLSVAQGSKQMATSQLRAAVTPEEVLTARAALNSAEQSEKDLIQLKDNLESRLANFQTKRNLLNTSREAALREVWRIKREELKAQFEIPEAVFLQMEMLLAALDGEKEGWGGRLFRQPVEEKYGRAMAYERSEELRESMLNELIAQLP
ncbi:hypothetical protein [Nitrincola sp.]|uniref:hypothetical protein n=1 Tax=Nitrincola sp. TaxID=1926584 RepID=UPI003A8C9D70